MLSLCPVWAFNHAQERKEACPSQASVVVQLIRRVLGSIEGLILFFFSPQNTQVDSFTHLYTLVLRPDLTYEVKIDGQSIESGSIEYDWQLTSLKKMEKASAEAEGWDQAAKDKSQVWILPSLLLEGVKHSL